jgi:hypothetical protein
VLVWQEDEPRSAEREQVEEARPEAEGIKTGVKMEALVTSIRRYRTSHACCCC